MIYLTALAVAYAVHRLLRWAIRTDRRLWETRHLEGEIRYATREGQRLLALDRIERREYHLLPKSRRAG